MWEAGNSVGTVSLVQVTGEDGQPPLSPVMEVCLSLVTEHAL